MKVRSTVVRAEEQLRAEMIVGPAVTAIESRIAYAVEQALKWTHTHRSTATPLDIARAQAKLLTTEIEAKIRNTRDAA